MALPNQISSTVPAGGDAPSTIDNRIRNLALGVEDILGIPDATNVSAAAFNIGSTGLSSINFQTAVTPSVSGVMARTGANLQYHDGTSSYSVTMNEKTQTLINKTLTSPILNGTITGNGTYSGLQFANPIITGQIAGSLDFDGLHTLGLNYPYSLNVSVASNNLTVEVRNVDGTALSSTSSVPFIFRNATLTTGTPVVRVADSVTSIIAPAGAALGFVANQVSRMWVGMVDSGTSALPFLFHSLDSSSSNLSIRVPTGTRITTTAIDVNSDNAGVAYSSAVQSNRPWQWIGYIEIQTGATAGNWSNSPSVVQVYYPWMLKPGDIVQTVYKTTGAVATGTTSIPADSSLPTSTEGDQFMAVDILPSSGVNIFDIYGKMNFANSSSGRQAITIIRDNGASASSVSARFFDSAGALYPHDIHYRAIVETAASTTTLKFRSGNSGGGTTTFNGETGAVRYAGVIDSIMYVKELMV